VREERTVGQSDNPGVVFDAHVRAEFVARDIDATMSTMADAPYVTHVPVLTRFSCATPRLLRDGVMP
jgi:carboxymethylenebutenolidase